MWWCRSAPNRCLPCSRCMRCRPRCTGSGASSLAAVAGLRPAEMARLDARRLAYLQAMQIDVWQRRELPADAERAAPVVESPVESAPAAAVPSATPVSSAATAEPRSAETFTAQSQHTVVEPRSDWPAVADMAPAQQTAAFMPADNEPAYGT